MVYRSLLISTIENVDGGAMPGQVAKATLLPGVLAVPPTPLSRCFLKITLKNDALACISEHFGMLRISNLENFSLNSLILLVLCLRGRFLDHF